MAENDTPPRGGIFAAALTLFDESEQIDWDLWARYLGWLCESGLDGVLAMGTTGEFALLSLEERLRGIRVAKGAVSPDSRLIVNVGAMTTHDAVCLAEAAAEQPRPADLLLCGPPFYHEASLTDERFSDHMWAVGEASAVPLLYYHIPKMTHFAPSAELLSETIDSAPLAGIKDSDGVIDFQRSVRARHPPGGLLYLSGSVDAAPESWAAGGDGAILGLASAMPRECAALWHHWQRGEHDAIAELHPRLCAVWGRASSKGIAGARALLGLIDPEFARASGRRPFAEVTAAQIEEIRAALHDNDFA